MLAVALVAVFTALGIWQIERRAWKLNLIETAATRAHAFAVPAPPPAAWSKFSPGRDVYRRVTVSGTLLVNQATLVQAVTEFGAGFWVITPVAEDRGFVVLVNRGFVPSRAQAVALCSDTAKHVTITGLIRASEPEGAFLRSNRPRENRWYSRDVGAIAEARGLNSVAPYFVDADQTPNPGGWPKGGLTVLRFSNNHLVYALTWFALALLSGYALVVLIRARARQK